MTEDDANADPDDADDPLADTLDDEPEGDPFEAIGEGTGPRHGDPFDAIDGEADSSDGDETATPQTDEAAADPDPTRHGLPEGENPFTEFDEQDGDPFAEETFGDATGPDVDADVWERMESTGADAEAVPGKRYVDVDKHSYCETCEYFSEPPDVACAHEGTEILEFIGMDTVRVVDCPIVAERKAIEDGE